MKEGTQLPTATTQAHVDAALYLKNKAATTYMALGKTSAWTNENIPPIPTESKTTLDELIGFKKMDTVSLCRPLAANETTAYPTISYNSQTWVLVPDAAAQTEKACYVYYEVKIKGTDLPTGEYRQVGVFTDLTRKTGVTKTNLLPTEVQSRGLLQFYDNRRRQNRTEQVTVIERFIVTLNG